MCAHGDIFNQPVIESKRTIKACPTLAFPAPGQLFLDKLPGGVRHGWQMPAPALLERLYDEHAGALFAFLLNITRAEADARDLLQEIFIKLAREPQKLAGIREERAFLMRLAHNAAVDLLRRRTVRDHTREGFAAELSPFAVADDPDEQLFRQELSTALGELPAEQRAVVHLKLWEGLTFEEIARVLDLPPNTAASRYRYGLDKLRGRLRPLYEEIK